MKNGMAKNKMICQADMFYETTVLMPRIIFLIGVNWKKLYAIYKRLKILLCIPEKSRLEGRYLAVQLHRPGQGGCSCQQDQVLAFLHQRLRCFGPGLLWVIVISQALYHKEES